MIILRVAMGRATDSRRTRTTIHTTNIRFGGRLEMNSSLQISMDDLSSKAGNGSFGSGGSTMLGLQRNLVKVES